MELTAENLRPCDPHFGSAFAEQGSPKSPLPFEKVAKLGEDAGGVSGISRVDDVELKRPSMEMLQPRRWGKSSGRLLSFLHLAALRRLVSQLSQTLMSYSGKVAIVTGTSCSCTLFLRKLTLLSPPPGGAGGIGLGITKHLLSSGAKVVIADVNATAGAKVIEGLAAE